MTREERLRILGADTVAEIHQMAAALPPPPPEVLEELRDLFAPALQRSRQRQSAPRHSRDTAA